MNILITKSTGVGDTELSAFDNALYNAGVANFNLIRLSSVIPEGAVVNRVSKYVRETKWGNKLYAVMAIQTTAKQGEKAVAGISWAYDENGENGLFVEHEGNDIYTVDKQLKDSLTNLFKTRQMELKQMDTILTDIDCKDKPVCAFVVAVFQEEDWNE